MFDLTRLTCEYMDREDRICLLGETTEGKTVVIWLTQRLLRRLVSHLCDWLEANAAVSEASTAAQWGNPVALWQGFAQQMAQSQLEPQAPVRVTSDAVEWLVREVDLEVGGGGQRIALSFKSDTGAAVTGIRVARMGMSVLHLRQWLGMLHRHFNKPIGRCRCGPDWMDDAPSSALGRWQPTPHLAALSVVVDGLTAGAECLVLLA